MHSVELLKERYGQNYKLVDAHMDALLNISAPSHNLASLKSFYNTININIRALSSLDQPPESYGTLLTSVILNKLAPETKTHMTRDHYDSQWTIGDLLASILKEIGILEASQISGRRPNSHASSILCQLQARFTLAPTTTKELHTKNLEGVPVAFSVRVHTNLDRVLQ